MESNLSARPQAGAGQNSAMPSKAEPFGHFRRLHLGFYNVSFKSPFSEKTIRLGFDNVFFKLPLLEKAIIRAFTRNPLIAYEKYSRKGVDKNTLEAMDAAGKKFDASLASDFESGKEIQAEIDKLSSELESIQLRRVSINNTYVRFRHHLKNSEKDHYQDTLKRFDAEICADTKWLSHLKRIRFEVKKAAAMPLAIEFLKAGLASAKKRNKSGAIG